MENCVFCKIAKGEIDSVKIREDEHLFAFLDINPLTKGHCLIIPKQHFESIFEIDSGLLEKIAASAKDLAEQMKKALGASGVNLVNASGKTAEQSVFHFHLHLIPRYENDGLEMNKWWQTKAKKADIEELKKLAGEIKK